MIVYKNNKININLLAKDYIITVLHPFEMVPQDNLHQNYISAFIKII